MIYTTLNKIRAYSPCVDGWKTLLDSLGKTKPDDEPLPLTHIIDSNNIDDALWCLQTLPEYDKQWWLFSIWCARQVQHLMDDQRSLDALDVAENYANDKASIEQLHAARDAARDAAWAASNATWAASNAAWDVARHVYNAAWHVAWHVANAAWDVDNAARAAQATELRRICEEHDNLETIKP